MKKSFILCTLLGLFVSCSSNNPSTNLSSTTSSLQTTSEEKVSSSIETSSSEDSSSIEKDGKEVLQNFLTRLLNLEGHVSSTSQTINATDFYLTNTLPFTMTMKEISSTTRYVDKDGNPLVVEEGKTGIASDIGEEPTNYENYVSQKMQDDQYLYQIIDYEKSNDMIRTYLRSATDVIFFNIGFPLSEYENFMFMITYFDSEAYNFEFSNLDQIVDDGVWEYEYEATFYEADTTIPKEVHRYKNKLTIENGIIVKLEQDSDVELYLGGIKANWSEYHVEREYFQGEYQIYEGNIFNPSDYN